MFDFMNERNKTGSKFRKAVVINSRHPKCLGDGFDDCGYDTTISCDDCKYNNAPFGKKGMGNIL
jgi:hypothetical protein